MFGTNLRILSAQYASISDLARQLGINRTQFNRYLSGESFPRPDVLARICGFFGVDARVLLEPVGQFGAGNDPIANSYLKDFLATGAFDLPERTFPSGFYRFSRRSFTSPTVFVLGIVHVHRRGQTTFIRGFESPQAMEIQGLPSTLRTREYRGVVMRQEDGIVFIASRRNSMTASFNYLSRVASFANNFWAGYITRTMPETEDSPRVTRMAFEALGPAASDALPAARAAGFTTEDALPGYHKRLLRVDTPFK